MSWWGRNNTWIWSAYDDHQFSYALHYLPIHHDSWEKTPDERISWVWCCGSSSITTQGKNLLGLIWRIIRTPGATAWLQHSLKYFTLLVNELTYITWPISLHMREFIVPASHNKYHANQDTRQRMVVTQMWATVPKMPSLRYGRHVGTRQPVCRGLWLRTCFSPGEA